ncbi:MAG: dCTP deaminase [Caldilineaceae bacterium]|nr:dCTP deaminase [Caldilineaceae bacterium]
MILPDWNIRQLCNDQRLVTPFDPARINPASLDLTIDGEIYDMTHSHHSTGDGVRILPGMTILATTCEVVRLPATVAATLALKSSMGRKGLSMPAAGWIDPGFCGTLTVQLSACVPVYLKVGDPFLQIIFQQMMSAPDAPYRGRYQNQSGVTLARDDGPASLNEVANEHVIYVQPVEGLRLYTDGMVD